MIPGDLAKAPAPTAIATDGLMIQHKPSASDVTSFELGAPHAGAHPLDDQVAFKLGDRPDDDHDGTSQWSARVDLFAEADELDVEPVQLIENFEEVLDRPGDSIGCP